MKTIFWQLGQYTILLLFLSVYSSVLSAQSYNCLDFDGSNDCIRIDDDNSIDLTSKGTLEAWIYIKSFKDWSGIIHKGERSDFNDEAYSLQFWGNYAGNTNKCLAISLDESTGSSIFTSSNTELETNTWYHVALVWNSRDHYAKLYINGNLDLEVYLGGKLASTGGDLFIGSQYNYGYPFNGKIDEVRIWNKSLSQETLRENMYTEINTVTSDLVAYYKLNESSSSSANDESSYNNDGSLTNMSTSDWESSSKPDAHEWLGSSSSDWDTDGNWFAGWKSSSNIPVLIPASATNQPVINGAYSCDALTVENGASLTINAGTSLTLNGALEVNGDIFIKSNTSQTGSLIDNGTVSGSGSVKFQRYIPASGWHYISTPVSDISSNCLWGAALYQYDEPTGKWEPIGPNESLTPMQGYDVYYQSSTYITFRGLPNTGTVTNSLLSSNLDGWNFIGNPYPSYIDWEASSGWTKTNIEEAFYMWDDEKGTFVSYINGIGSHSDIGGVIPPTQGFWVKVNSGTTGTLGMTNDVRVHNTTYKFRSNQEIEALNLTVTSHKKSDQTSIAFKQYADDYFETNNDARKLFSDESDVPQLYTKSAELLELSINALPEFYDKTSVPLYLKVNVSGTTSIKISDSCNFNENINIYLEDLLSGDIKDMRQGAYEFYADVNESEDRFIVHFINPQSIYNNTSSIDETTQNAEIFSSGSNIYINHSNAYTEATIYSIMGKEIMTKTIESGQINILQLSEEANGYYIVTLNGKKGNFSTKVFIN